MSHQTWQEKQKAMDELIREASIKLNQQVEIGMIEQFLALVNSGVIKVYITPGRVFNESQTKITLEQNVGVKFEGKEKIIQLENVIQGLVLQLHGALDDLEWEEFCEENEDLQRFIDQCEVT